MIRVLDPCGKYGHRTADDVLFACGVLLYWMRDDDPRSLKQQLEDNYEFPCRWNGDHTFDKGAFLYPEDPPLYPYIEYRRGDEAVLIYPHSIVVYITKETPNGEYTRMD